MIEFLDYILRRLVDHPQEIKIERNETDKTVDFLLTLHPEDIGKVIGRRGRTIGSIRALINTAAVKYGKRATVEIKDAPSDENVSHESE